MIRLPRPIQAGEAALCIPYPFSLGKTIPAIRREEEYFLQLISAVLWQATK